MSMADQLFATLDPTLRRLQIQDVGTAILADTVGFVRQLPHDLVSAFKSTLQETVKPVCYCTSLMQQTLERSKILKR